MGSLTRNWIDSVQGLLKIAFEFSIGSSGFISHYVSGYQGTELISK